MTRPAIFYHGRHLTQVGISWYDETGRWLGVSYAEARRSVDKQAGDAARVAVRP